MSTFTENASTLLIHKLNLPTLEHLPFSTDSTHHLACSTTFHSHSPDNSKRIIIKHKATFSAEDMFVLFFVTPFGI